MESITEASSQAPGCIHVPRVLKVAAWTLACLRIGTGITAIHSPLSQQCKAGRSVMHLCVTQICVSTGSMHMVMCTAAQAWT